MMPLYSSLCAFRAIQLPGQYKETDRKRGHVPSFSIQFDLVSDSGGKLL